MDTSFPVFCRLSRGTAPTALPRAGDIPLARLIENFVLSAVLSAALAFLPGVTAARASAAEAPPMPVKPDAVTLYPNRAMVTVRQTLAPGTGSFVLTFPETVERASLAVEAIGNSVSGLVWDEPVEILPAAGLNPERERLLAELEGLRLEEAGFSGTIRALEAEAAFWEKADAAKISTVEEMEKLAKAIVSHLPETQKALPALRRKLERTKERIGEVEARLNGMGSERFSLLRCRVALDKTPSAPQELVYSYMLGGCAWTPAYRLDAVPGSGLVLFRQEAEVWQKSGFDWSGAKISLATALPSPRLTPRPLPGWPVGPLPARQLARKQNVMPEGVSGMLTPLAALPAGPEPDLQETATFQQWDLGPRPFPSGELLRFTLVRDEEWKGDFRYILRPGVQDKGFLGVKAKLPAHRELPRGPAVYAVDGRIVGSASFACNGDEAELFFGPDALVSAAMRLINRVGGDRGLISKERSETWEWEIKAVNGHSFPVNIRVEDSMPQPSEEAIRVLISSEPAPEKDEKGFYVWGRELAPRGEFRIRHRVEIKAPESMPLDPGR
ncbi:MAG: DUF4139 domain-containing protein [Desulfovibrio sp.]|jgi:hypothetical protein|nr:DUF4139 domain-containing protein [Desulfovibrio sp.]